MTNKTVTTEYFFQLTGVTLPVEFTNLYAKGISKSFRQTMTPNQALELGTNLIAAGMHAKRYDHQQKKRVGIRTKIEPIDEVLITTHNSGQITVLGRARKRNRGP